MINFLVINVTFLAILLVNIKMLRKIKCNYKTASVEKNIYKPILELNKINMVSMLIHCLVFGVYALVFKLNYKLVPSIIENLNNVTIIVFVIIEIYYGLMLWHQYLYIEIGDSYITFTPNLGSKKIIEIDLKEIANIENSKSGIILVTKKGKRYIFKHSTLAWFYGSCRLKEALLTL